MAAGGGPNCGAQGPVCLWTGQPGLESGSAGGAGLRWGHAGAHGWGGHRQGALCAEPHSSGLQPQGWLGPGHWKLRVLSPPTLLPGGAGPRWDMCESGRGLPCPGPFSQCPGGLGGLPGGGCSVSTRFQCSTGGLPGCHSAGSGFQQVGTLGQSQLELCPRGSGPGRWWPCGSHVVDTYPPACSEQCPGWREVRLVLAASMEVTGPPGPSPRPWRSWHSCHLPVGPWAVAWGAGLSWGASPVRGNVLSASLRPGRCLPAAPPVVGPSPHRSLTRRGCCARCSWGLRPPCHLLLRSRGSWALPCPRGEGTLGQPQTHGPGPALTIPDTPGPSRCTALALLATPDARPWAGPGPPGHAGHTMRLV